MSDAAIDARPCVCGPGESCSECPGEDDEGALPCAECPPDKEPRWRTISEQQYAEETDALLNGPEGAVTLALKRAAIRLRDAELERQAAGKAYAEALDAFNRCVAPVGP